MTQADIKDISRRGKIAEKSGEMAIIETFDHQRDLL